MDVLLSITKTCRCCGARSAQPVYAAAFADAGAPLDGSTVAGRLNRGMQLCADCGHAAPDLEVAPRGMTRDGLRAAMAATSYRRALGHRGAVAVRDEAASRWLAYAAAFEGALRPSDAGLAWVNAAAELEQARLHRLGSTATDSRPDQEQAHVARRKAIGHLARVFEAEFGPADGPARLAVLRRTLRRWQVGEPVFQAARWSAVDHLVTNTSSHARFELACTLTDLLRRTGEFVAARSIALRALHTGEAPHHLAVALSFQLRLCGDEATGLFRNRDLVDTVVAFPTVAATGTSVAFRHDNLAAAA